METETNQNIIIIGAGSLTVNVAAALRSFGKEPLLIEIRNLAFFSIVGRARRSGIPLVEIDKKEVPAFLKQKASKRSSRGQGRTLLVLSIENRYIFPTEVVEDPAIEIINYHNSILPRHRGANAEAWTIFEGDKQAGFTWHRIDRGLDTGAIVYQRQIKTGPRDTSLTLLRDCSKLALKTFRDLLPILQKKEQRVRPSNAEALISSYHSASDRPNGGILDPCWSLGGVSGFLRAFDYGKLQLLGSPVIMIGGLAYTWEDYRIEAIELSPCFFSRRGRCFCDINIRDRQATFSVPDEGSITLEGLLQTSAGAVDKVETVWLQDH